MRISMKISSGVFMVLCGRNLMVLRRNGIKYPGDEVAQGNGTLHERPSMRLRWISVRFADSRESRGTRILAQGLHGLRTGTMSVGFFRGNMGHRSCVERPTDQVGRSRNW
jgi:hypothetical protein